MPYGKNFNRQSMRGQTAGGYSMTNIPEGQNLNLQGQMDDQLQPPMTANDGVNVEN